MALSDQPDLGTDPAPFLPPVIRWLSEVSPRWSRKKWGGALLGMAALFVVQGVVLATVAFWKVESDYQAQGITDGGGIDGDTHASGCRSCGGGCSWPSRSPWC